MDAERIKQERERLDHLECPERDTRETAPLGVLLSDEIERYVGEFRLIWPFNKKDQLKPAGYELSIGDEYVLGGERNHLGKDSEIRIPPFNVVVIKTAETINLPRFLIARWNVRVKWAYEGLLWVGAAQVDPGWVGHLFCPLYNLSNKEVVLRFGDPIALMDFVTTTPFRPAESIKYLRPPKRVLLEEYQAAELKSALYTLATTTLKGFEENVKQINATVESRVSAIQSRVDYFVLITFTVIAVLFAAVTIFVARSEQLSWWNPIPLFLLNGTALFFSASAWIRAYQEQRFFGRVVQSLAIAILLVAAVLTVVGLKETGPLYQQINDLKGKVDGLQQQIKTLSPVPAPSSPPASTPPAAPNAANQDTHKKSQGEE